MQIVPLAAVPSQTVTTTLAGQTVQVNVYSKLFGVFLDLYVQNTLIIAGAICQDRNRVVRSAYLGFSGDLMFVDQQGTSDPVYTGIGTRFLLMYLVVGEF